MKPKNIQGFVLIIKKIPFLGDFLIFILRWLKFNLYYRFHFLKNKLKSKAIDIYKVYWINPKDIKYISGRSRKLSLIDFKVPNDVGGNYFHHTKDRGLVTGGNWDKCREEFENLLFYKAAYIHFVEGKDWEETEFYKHALKKVKNGVLRHVGIESEEQYKKRLQNIDILFQDIKECGYRLATEKKNIDTYNVDSGKKSNTLKTPKGRLDIDEVLINIGRDGEPLFMDGAHRLTIAKLLKLDKIPVMVAVRHKEWVAFRNELFTYANLQPQKKLYQKAYHFDLEDIPYIYDEERIEIVKKHTSLKKGTVLDIGAYFGLHCHELEKAGFDCWAVESNLTRIYFTKKLREANKDRFKIVNQSIFDFKKDEKLNFDIILALNIFHHFLKNKETYAQLKNLLNRLDCKEMYFESHNPKEEQMKGAYVNYGPEEFVKFIIEESCLGKYKLLQKFERGRELYKISK